MQAAKILGVAVAGLVVLVAAVLLSVWRFVDADHYKPRLVETVKHATGRDLMLHGDMTLSVFPWVALELGAGSLGNPPGFGDRPFLSFRHAALRLRLLPLLTGRLEIGRVELDGVEVRLVRDAGGLGNWEGLGETVADAASAVGSAAAHGATSALGAARMGHPFAGLSGIKITQARILYGPYTLENLDLETGAVGLRELEPVKLHFEATRGVAAERVSVEATFDMSVDGGAQHYRVAALHVLGAASLTGKPRPVRFSLLAPAVDLNLAGQTLTAAAFDWRVAGAELSGSVQGSGLLDAPRWSGRVALGPLLVREFLPRLGVSVPPTRDPRVLSLVSGSGAFSYEGRVASLDDVRVTLDDLHWTGHAVVTAAPQPTLRFALALDRIDLDRYLPPVGEVAEARTAAVVEEARTAAAANRVATAAALGAGAGAAADAATGAAATGATADAAALEVNGSLTVGAVRVASLDLAAVRVTVAASAGVVHLFPLQAAVDGGLYSGNVTLDRRGSVPLLTLDEHLTGIEVGRLWSGDKGLGVSGRGSVSLQAAAQGTGAEALLRTLHGRLQAEVTQGAVEGVDVGFQLARAEALLRRPAGSAPRDTGRTRFDALKMSAQIVDGVARTRDLEFSSDVLEVTGQGSVDLPAKTVDLALLADTRQTVGTVPVQIPIRVSGAVGDPAVRPDLDALARGPLGHQVEQLLKDKLRGLFGR